MRRPPPPPHMRLHPRRHTLQSTRQPALTATLARALLLAAACAPGFLQAAPGAEAPRRDPLLAPAEARPAPAPGAGADGSDAAAALPTPRQLMTVDGRRYLVVGTRRLGVGDRLGSARIERIEDNAVIVREGTALQRLPLHGSVVKRPAPETAGPAAPTHTRSTPRGAP